MKKIVIILISIIILITILLFGVNFINSPKIHIPEVKYKKSLTLEYGKIAYVSDFVEIINGKLIDKKIQYTDTGKQIIEYQIINEQNKEITQKLTLNILDTSAPIVMLNKKLTIVQESVDNLTDKIMCADNYDKNPKCEVVGNYDLSKAGVYPLTFSAEDSHGNKTIIDFELNIIEKTSSYSNSETQITEVINNHKNEKTKVGIDVSKWQGDIDWKTVKSSGVEFAMIRVGTQGGFGKDSYVDKQFVNNIENALKEDIPVGIYFYSYATTKEEAIAQAKWVIEQIKDYKITLPVVFDWESWAKFNSLDLNLYEITEVQETFLNEIQSAGYKTARYGSKNYLTNAWQETEHLTWLAHYTNSTNYEGDYFMWQLCNNGVVPGIKGYVDINIFYD